MTFRLAEFDFLSYSYTMNSGGLSAGSLKYTVHNDGRMVALTQQSLDQNEKQIAICLEALMALVQQTSDNIMLEIDFQR